MAECRVFFLPSSILRYFCSTPYSRIVGDGSEDPYTIWEANTERALAIELGGSSANGNRVVIDAPKLQIVNPQEGDRNGIQTDDIEFQLNASAAAGDDELTLTFS